MARFAAFLAFLLLAAPALAAGPVDEALRFAPPDAAFCLIASDLRGHAHAVAASPFAAWLPTTPTGRAILDSAEFRKLDAVADSLTRHLGTTPGELRDDVFGDAVVFAFQPGPPDRPKDEAAVILVRPRKPDVLARLFDRLNQAQTASGELKAVVKRTHNGRDYFERRKAAGGSEFYCQRGGVFAFSSQEPLVRGVLDRDAAASEWSARVDRLGVRDAALAFVVNPRALDAEVRAKAAATKPDEKPLADRVAAYWAGLDCGAVFVRAGADLDVGFVARFRPEALPPGGQKWLSAPRVPSALWAAIPENALVAVAGQQSVTELLETVGGLMPGDGKSAVQGAVAQTIGIGRDRVGAVLDALGPDWGVWVVAPAGAGHLPVLTAALRVRTDAPRGEASARAVLQGIDYGFLTLRLWYNVSHPDQIEFKAEKQGDTEVKYLAGEKGLPFGFRPAFALKDGYLLLTTSPAAVASFRGPKSSGPPGEVPLLRASASALRAYLAANRTMLADLTNPADTKAGLRDIDQLAALLEPLDRLDVTAAGDDRTVRVVARFKFAKPLK